MVLPVNVTTDLQWRLQLEKRVLREEDLTGTGAERFELAFRDDHELAWFRAACLGQ